MYLTKPDDAPLCYDGGGGDEDDDDGVEGVGDAEGTTIRYLSIVYGVKTDVGDVNTVARTPPFVSSLICCKL